MSDPQPPLKLLWPSRPGGGGGGDTFVDAMSRVKVNLPGDANLAQTDLLGAQITHRMDDVNLAQLDALNVRISGLGDTNAAQTDSVKAALRYFAGASSDNVSGRTTPANANGANNGTNAVVKTATQLGDTTNPVVLTSTTFNVPATFGANVTVVDRRLRVWASIADPLLDTARLLYNVGAGDVVFHTGTLAAATLGTTFALPAGITQSQLSSLVLKASYQSAVVLLPTSQINLDAWCVEFDITFS
jgi:hypothetical protein